MLIIILVNDEIPDAGPLEHITTKYMIHMNKKCSPAVQPIKTVDCHGDPPVARLFLYFTYFVVLEFYARKNPRKTKMFSTKKGVGGKRKKVRGEKVFQCDKMHTLSFRP